MLPHICHCCGGRIAASDQGRGMLICKDCEQLTTDDSPQVSALTLEALAVEPEPPAPASNPGGNRRPPAMARQETGTTG